MTTSTLVSQQKQLTDYIRDPDGELGPADISPRRLEIYRDLFFNTVEGFLSTAFPVLRSLCSDPYWRAMVRDFLRRHRCESPYFVEVAQEFLGYLSDERQRQDDDPPFLLELAHYEWVELALDISTESLPVSAWQSNAALPDTLVQSPLAWSLAYEYPVHRIGPDFRPEAPEAQPTFLLVYRNRQDAVAFLEINVATARLLELLAEHEGSVGASLGHLAAEMAMPLEGIQRFASELLTQMLELDILLAE